MNIKITIEVTPSGEYRGEPVHGVLEFDGTNEADMMALEMMQIQLGQVEDKESAEEWGLSEEVFEDACTRMAEIVELTEKARTTQIP